MTNVSATLEGTYRLVSDTHTVVETGEVIESFGQDPTGYIMYGRDHRMMVLMVRSDRPKPTVDSVTDSQRV